MTVQSPPSSEHRVLLVGSSGGHLTQLMGLRSWWAHTERAWVTFKTDDAVGRLSDEARVVWAYSPTTRNIPNLLRNTVVAWRVLRSFQPHVVISTGAGVALPFFVLAHLFGVRTVYVEVFDRIDSATLTGRLCRPFTDLMLVQSTEQERLYRGALVVGPLL